MSLPRITEILESELITGWTAELITASDAETVTVKATAGKVARIKVVTGVITVTPYNGLVAAWAALTNAAELDLTGLTGTPMTFDTSIKLAFSAAGTAWILYK